MTPSPRTFYKIFNPGTKAGIRVDFIFSYTPFENDAIKRAKTVTIMGQKLAFAAPEDFIIHKSLHAMALAKQILAN